MSPTSSASGTGCASPTGSRRTGRVWMHSWPASPRPPAASTATSQTSEAIMFRSLATPEPTTDIAVLLLPWLPLFSRADFVAAGGLPAGAFEPVSEPVVGELVVGKPVDGTAGCLVTGLVIAVSAAGFSAAASSAAFSLAALWAATISAAVCGLPDLG